MTLSKIEIYTNLLFDCFKSDSGIIAQLNGIDDSSKIFKAHCKSEIEAFSKTGFLSAVEDDGIMVSYLNKELELPENIRIFQESSKYILEAASSEELTIMQNNALKVLEIAKPDWYKKFIGENPVYVLQIIAVTPKMRGKGVFRKLIAPLIEKSDSEKTPIILQTHEEENLKKYEHFGFKIMESLYSEELNLNCYNMLRYPE